MRTRTALLGVLLVVAGCSPDASPPPQPVSMPTIGIVSPVPTTPPAARTAPPVPVIDAGLGATPVTPAPAPVSVSVPAVGLDLPVDPEGVSGDGQMELPNTAERAGWYRFGPAPDSPAGATVIAGHVDSSVSGIGQFSKLRHVPVGSEVTVTTADGSAHRYRVVEVIKVAKADAPLSQWFDRSGPARLVLLTCGGTFDRSTGHYRDNVVVTAERIG